MLNFLKRQADKNERAKAEIVAEYRKLLAKAASAGDLSDKETESMTAIMFALRISHSDVEADVAALKRAAELEKMMENAANLAEAKSKAKAIVIEARNNVEQRMKAVKDDAAQKEEAYQAAADAVIACNAAATDLENLRAQNPRLFEAV